VGPRNHVLRKGTFEGYMCLPVVTYLQITALPACVPAMQFATQMNAFAAARVTRCGLLPNYFRHLFAPYTSSCI